MRSAEDAHTLRLKARALLFGVVVGPPGSARGLCEVKGKEHGPLLGAQRDVDGARLGVASYGGANVQPGLHPTSGRRTFTRGPTLAGVL